MSSRYRFRDALRAIVPWWLSDRHGSNGKTVGFRFLWSMVAPLDALLEFAFQGVTSALPGLGNPDALPIVGRSRGVIRAQGESNADYAARLRAWLDKAKTRGTQEGLARAIHEYLEGRPTVRVVNRAGRMVTVKADGTTVVHQTSWDWDSVSHPERAEWWSDLWVIVYRTSGRWDPEYIGTDLTNCEWLADRTTGAIGNGANRVEIEAILGELAQYKSAHSRIRAVIFTLDTERYDPDAPTFFPDGTWGAWGNRSASHRTRSGRFTTDRFWEPK